MAKGRKPKKAKQAELPLEAESKQEKPKKQKAQFDFESSLVLFKYLLSVFDSDSLDKLCSGMKETNLEGWDEEGISRFYRHLTNRTVPFSGVTNDDLLRYDNNIASHTREITRKRPDFRWKYFQYMALLFTEVYLDRYFSGRERLAGDLNAFLEVNINSRLPDDSRLKPYTEEDLNKIAFWQATGSGKTLLMHVNILQYKHYHSKAAGQKDINKTILLTPNEGLSNQHKGEFELSGMQADLFSKDSSGLFGGKFIEIIDVHKLKEEGREKTVSIEAFEGDNLVLVDEGHRGAGGEEWMKNRDKLCEDGFSFEYSATFGQAMKASGKPEMLVEYAKCIIFDYSYKYFYGDGYGKEYSILNLAEKSYDDKTQEYMTACLLTFYQQLKYFHENRADTVRFNIEKPLWVFVGKTVNKGTKESGVQITDVIRILHFFREFCKSPAKSKKTIDTLIKGRSILLDDNNNDIFNGRFDYLAASGADADGIFADIMRALFNAGTSEAQLHVDLLKGVEGEIGLKFGDNDYFGVINVGDDSGLVHLCSENGFVTATKDFSQSLFTALSSADSKVNVLIGSKKFTEGWNSWRVSTLGLMNVGRSEGSEIIQLFGRGVRLKGYKECLKRSKHSGIKRPKSIETAETLNVFGIRADYMNQFREYLETEGVKGSGDYEEIRIPTVKNFDAVKLKYPVLKEGTDFGKQGGNRTLSEPDEYLKKHPVIVNWYPRIEAMQSKGIRSLVAVEPQKNPLKPDNIAFFDYDKIYFELQKYKNERYYNNLNFDTGVLRSLLARDDWYVLYIDRAELDFTRFEKVFMWQEIAVSLLKKYMDSYYNAARMDYEKDKIVYKYLDEMKEEDKKNFFDEYEFLVEKSRTGIIENIKKLGQAISQGKLDDAKFDGLVSFNFERHLYRPLIHIKGLEVKMSPVELNEYEKNFVMDLRNYYLQNKKDFKERELYLLRNLGRGRGIGFFQAHNFYPDFIMWVVEGGKQFITFVDPHGMRHHLDQLGNPKVMFHKEIKKLQEQIGDKDVILNSFIVSDTQYKELVLEGVKISQDEYERHNVFFQDTQGEYIQKIIKNID